jgi:hypothetical protein
MDPLYLNTEQIQIPMVTSGVISGVRNGSGLHEGMPGLRADFAKERGLSNLWRSGQGCPLLRASSDIDAPSKLARYLSRDGG